MHRDTVTHCACPDCQAIDLEVETLFATGRVAPSLTIVPAPALPIRDAAPLPSGFALSINGEVYDAGLSPDRLRAAVADAACLAIRDQCRHSDDVDAESIDLEAGAEVEVTAPEGGQVGAWEVRVQAGHEGHDIEECWGIRCRRPVWIVDIDETVTVEVTHVAQPAEAVAA